MSQMVRLIRSGDSWPPRVWEPLCGPGIPPVKLATRRSFAVFRVDRRQPLPYRIREQLPVIRE